jgi:hypothetical protein
MDYKDAVSLPLRYAPQVAVIGIIGTTAHAADRRLQGFPYRDFLTGIIIPVRLSLRRSGSKLFVCAEQITLLTDWTSLC